MEKGTDKIIIDNGEFFEGTRDMFRDCFFDNATNEQIIDFCNVEGVSVNIYCGDEIAYATPKPTDLRKEYTKETGNDPMAYIQRFAGDRQHEDGFSDEYVLWLQNKIQEQIIEMKILKGVITS